MKTVKVLDKEFKISITSAEIRTRVQELAKQISSDMGSSDPLFLGILNGSFMFACDLFKELTVDAQITFIKVTSYEGAASSGRVKELIGLNQDIGGRNIIILEDIVDTGTTIDTIINQISSFKPASIRIATLLYKPSVSKTRIKIDYTGFIVNDDFVIGYGLDYNGYGRKYADIYSLIDD